MLAIRRFASFVPRVSARCFTGPIVGKKFEQTTLPTVVFPDRSVKSVEFPTANKYTIVFFYPLDFTFVCPSEIIAFSNAVEEFKKRGVDIYGCSCDSHFSHIAWMNTPIENGGIGNIQLPLIADFNKTLGKSLNVVNEAGVSLRGLYLFDSQGVVRHQLVNDLPLGRNVDEALRIVDALKHFEENGEVCPANWRKGQQAMKATPKGVAEYLTNTHGKN